VSHSSVSLTLVIHFQVRTELEIPIFENLTTLFWLPWKTVKLSCDYFRRAVSYDDIVTSWTLCLRVKVNLHTTKQRNPVTSARLPVAQQIQVRRAVRKICRIRNYRRYGRIPSLTQEKHFFRLEGGEDAPSILWVCLLQRQCCREEERLTNDWQKFKPGEYSEFLKCHPMINSC
jgi:hypothetical protein